MFSLLIFIYIVYVIYRDFYNKKDCKTFNDTSFSKPKQKSNSSTPKRKVKLKFEYRNKIKIIEAQCYNKKSYYKIRRKLLGISHLFYKTYLIEKNNTLILKIYDRCYIDKKMFSNKKITISKANFILNNCVFF